MEVKNTLISSQGYRYIVFFFLKAFYIKSCFKRLLKIDKTKILVTNGSLTKIKIIAECLEHSAILLAFIER